MAERTGNARELDGLLVQWANGAGRPKGPEPRFCTGVPNLFNFDSLGYNNRVIRKRPEQVSWAELMNDRWRGRVALNTSPDTGLYDTASAVRAAGIMRDPDLGNLTRRDIDALVKVMLAYKKRGHFFGVWSNSYVASDWMTHGQVAIQSMFAMIARVPRASGHPVRQAAPPEGYRAFGDLFSISSEVKDRAKLQACYDFINWWQAGFAGSVLIRRATTTPSRRRAGDSFRPASTPTGSRDGPRSKTTGAHSATPPSGRDRCVTAAPWRVARAGSRSGTRGRASMSRSAGTTSC